MNVNFMQQSPLTGANQSNSPPCTKLGLLLASQLKLLLHRLFTTFSDRNLVHISPQSRGYTFHPCLSAYSITELIFRGVRSRKHLLWIF